MYAHYVMGAIFLFQNNEMVAMLLYQTNVGVQLFSYVNMAAGNVRAYTL